MVGLVGKPHKIPAENFRWEMNTSDSVLYLLHYDVQLTSDESVCVHVLAGACVRACVRLCDGG